MKQRSDFEIYLRTGRRIAAERDVTELKFNPWHDPDDGRFTFAGQGRYFGSPRSGGSSSGNRAAPSAAGRAPAAARTSSPQTHRRGVRLQRPSGRRSCEQWAYPLAAVSDRSVRRRHRRFSRRRSRALGGATLPLASGPPLCPKSLSRDSSNT